MKHLQYILVLLLLGIFASTQVYAQEEAPFTAGVFIEGAASSPRMAKAVDIDDDGDLDPYYASFNSVGWFENLGDSSFSPPQIITSQLGEPNSVHAEDLNGDDLPDLVVTALTNDKISWYANMGSGDFGGEQVLASEKSSPASVISSDLNDDDLPDIIALAQQDDELFWMPNEGDGSFGSPQTISGLVSSPRSVYPADLSGDGVPDLVVATSGGNRIVWFKNNGDGSFSNLMEIDTDADNGWAVFAKDLTGDGALDVISASAGAGEVVWYENMGDDTFGAQQLLSEDIDGAESVVAGDIDNDGDADVVATGSDWGQTRVSLFVNDGSGSFSAENYLEDIGGASVFITNIIGSDAAEILYASIEQNQIAWMPVQEDTLGAPHSLTTKAAGVFALEATDVNMDGHLDVVSTSEEVGEIVWYPGDGTGNFGAQQSVGTDIGGPRTFRIVDMNSDGNPDILTVGFFGQQVYWYENNGDGTFSDGNAIGDNDLEGPTSIDAADKDDDGDMDVFVALHSDDEFIVYENVGNLEFTDKLTVDVVNEATAIRAEDVTGDGFPDLIAGSGYGKRTAWYENNGDGTFSESIDLDPHNDFGSGIYVTTAFFLDDNQRDVLLTTDTQIGLNINQGGSFGNMKVVVEDGIEFGKKVRAADADGDGDLDLFFTEEYNGLSWVENLGDTTFAAPQLISDVDSYYNGLVVADFDEDGLPDPVVGTTGNNVIKWFRNQTTTSIQENTPGTVPQRVKLEPAYPNPFNPATTIQFSLPVAQSVTLEVYDITGKKVRTLVSGRKLAAGQHAYQFDGDALSSGIYFYRIRTAKTTIMRKMTLVK